MARPRRSLAQLRALARNVAMLAGLSDENVAADWVQELVEHSEITDRAPDDVRAAVDVAVELHTYGMFAWVFFTAATLQARLTRELALGFRFLEFYGRRVPVEQRVNGQIIATDVLDGSELRVVRERLGNRGSHPRRNGWRVVGHSDFDGGLTSLYHWARRENVLRPWLDRMWAGHSPRTRETVFFYGVEQERPIPPRPADFSEWTNEQRERWFQHEFRDGWEARLIRREVDMRNDAAHPTMQAVYMPTWSANEIEALASFVNLLWPAPASAG